MKDISGTILSILAGLIPFVDHHAHNILMNILFFDWITIAQTVGYAVCAYISKEVLRIFIFRKIAKNLEIRQDKKFMKKRKQIFKKNCEEECDD